MPAVKLCDFSGLRFGFALLRKPSAWPLRVYGLPPEQD